VNLKTPEGHAAVRALLADADVLIEQFRPGVMGRLGLSYQDLSEGNPRLIYCSITGYGQNGPKAQLAAHDLNYVGDTGMLSLVTDKDGTPSIPAIALADIGGGAYPAMINILLALMERTKTGRGRHLDIAMSENVLPFLYWALGNNLSGAPPRPSGELTTGGSPRYAIYRTRDQRFLAVAPLEDKFWNNFCSILDVVPSAAREEIAERFAIRSADEWMRLFEGQDVCCSIVRTMDEALQDEHFRERGCFDRLIEVEGSLVVGLPLPIERGFSDAATVRKAPSL